MGNVVIREIRKYHDLNGNQNAAYKHFGDQHAVLVKHILTLNTYVRKEMW